MLKQKKEAASAWRCFIYLFGREQPGPRTNRYSTRGMLKAIDIVLRHNSLILKNSDV